jgi:tetratricopeptide (TPR) repeat protein
MASGQWPIANGQSLIALFLLLAALAVSAWALRRVDRISRGLVLEDVLFIPSGHTLKRMSLGYDGLLADLYWTRVVQYFGGKHHDQSLRYDLLAPLLDITTDLDPHLLPAYQFGSIFLAQTPPEGAGQPQKAVALVEKGIRENPEIWQLYFNLGWIEYSELKDYQLASQTFLRGSQVPGASPALQVLAGVMAQHLSDSRTARFLWTQIYQTTDNKMVRNNALLRLAALQVDDDIARLEQEVSTYERAFGHPPASWAQMEAAGGPGPFTDPFGRPYRLMTGGRVEAADPNMPFITRGLPPTRKPFVLDKTP